MLPFRYLLLYCHLLCNCSQMYLFLKKQKSLSERHFSLQTKAPSRNLFRLGRLTRLCMERRCNVWIYLLDAGGLDNEKHKEMKQGQDGTSRQN